MSFHEIINTIIFNRKPILTVTVLTTILLFLILLFVYPLSYEAPVTILPPEKNSKMGGLSSLLGVEDFSGMVTSGLSNASSQLFAEILKSRTAALYVVRKHNLVEFYKSKNEIEAARELNDNLNIKINKEGIISLGVKLSTSFFPLFSSEKDSVKKLSVKISNSYVEALDKINREKLASKAKRARIYIESQLDLTKKLLDSAEYALMQFQKKNKTVSLPDQVKAAIESAANLKSDIIKTEIELGLLEPNLKENSRILVNLKSRLQELRNQYSKMEMGNQDYLVAFKDVPEIGRELAQLFREVKIQNEVYFLLEQQYFKEKIQENRDLPTVEILDEAIPPRKPVSPRLILSTIVGSVLSFLIMAAVAIINEQKITNYKSKNS